MSSAEFARSETLSGRRTPPATARRNSVSAAPLKEGFLMTGTPNPAVTGHMPWFMTAPGATDGLFVAMVLLLLLAIVSIGNLYFKLHALPERRAHKANKTQ